MFDCLIVNGRVVDGTGSPWFPADVGIRNGKIAAIGKLAGTAAAQTVDATGLVVTPGFVDVHNHSDFTLLANPSADCAVRQGVTTLVVGNCGLSAAPIREPELVGRFIYGYVPEVPITWRTFGEYLDRVQAGCTAVNVAALVGHCFIRSAAMRFDARPPTAAELADMRRLVHQSLEEGAFGLSFGLEYAPSLNADLAEMVELAGVAVEHGRLVTSHIRNRDFHYVRAVKEMLALVEATGASMQISHLTSRYGAARSDDATVWRLIDEARARGFDITCDMMPSRWGFAQLSKALPAWAFEGGTARLVERLRDPAMREQFKAYRYPQVKALAAGKWDKLVMVLAKRSPEVVGKTLEQVAGERGCDPYDAVLDILLAEGEDADGIFMAVEDYVDDEILRQALTHPLYMFQSDGWVAPYGPVGPMVNPRSYGWVATLLGELGRDRGWFRLEDAVRRLTSFPAQRLGITDRGLLREGMWGDVAIFNAETIAANDTLFDPGRYPSGVEHVFVNGQWVVERGNQTAALPGKVLRA
ncbi:MAG: D-aminoacylase [Chloroflexi bacterium]|nr:D-aminoacylase [Chloroflexota bacterium]